MPLSEALPSQMTGRQVHDGAGTRDPAGAWKVFDSSDEAETPDEVEFLDEGEIDCDGTNQQASAEGR